MNCNSFGSGIHTNPSLKPFKNLYSQEKIIDFHFLNFSQEKESVSQCIRDLKAMAPA